MDFPKHEEETLAYWKERDIFIKTLEKDAPKGAFVFFEGPPTANGRPGIHHAEARAFKDCIPRFRTMQGYRVLRKGGWDTHGLPVEIEVEKQLGFTSKAQIEEFGIAKFNELCRQSVWKYKKEWEAFTQRLGFWVDLENAYVTYAPEYVESLWWVIKQVWDRGLLYKDYRVTPHCPRCGTSLSSHELSQGYKDVKDLAVTAKFRVRRKGVEEERSEGAKEYLLAWTTTPWTLPGNVALAVGKDIDYVKVKKFVVNPNISHVPDGSAFPKATFDYEYYWMAKDRLGILEGRYEIVDEVKGGALVGMSYEPLYPYLESVIARSEATKQSHEEIASVGQDGLPRNDSSAFTVLPADFVTTEDGTGIVHTAVMYGQDDFELGTKVGLPKHHLVKLDGTFNEGMDFLSGRLVTDEQVAIDIIKDLAHRGLLFAKEKYEHSYPHCWRCKSKVIYYAKDSWYIRMSELRDEMLKQNEQIHWEPAHIQDGRFGEWLREVKDWAFSRERYWGTPLPIWECAACDHKMCVGSFDELRSLRADVVGEAISDPHRPYVDDILLKCEKCGGEARRVPDVCDVWFDSGAMPFAQWHYPFEHRELIDSGDAFPADYISEAIDQTRGWFYTLLAVATLLGRERPFKNVICLGHVMDAEGKKMSKSLGNIVEPMEMMNKHGADAVRWYMYTINQPGESKRFDEKALVEMVRQNFGILWNVVEFYRIFSTQRLNDSTTPSLHVLDRWILARLHKLTKETTERLEAYVITETVRELGAFITDLSTWYVRRSRDRFKATDVPPSQGGTEGGSDKAAAIATLRECLLTLAKLMAPFAPFLAERVYQTVGGEKESVHLEDWPEIPSKRVDEDVIRQMAFAREVVSIVLQQRADASINVRQPLAGMRVHVPHGFGITFTSGGFGREYLEIIQDEVNVLDATFDEKSEVDHLEVELDFQLTPELLRMGMVREIIRRANALRKKVGLTIEDRIELFVSGSEEVMKAVAEHRDTLLHTTLAHAVRTDGETPQQHESFEVGEEHVTIGIDLQTSL